MSINHPFSRLKIKRKGGTPAPPPPDVPFIEHNPNYVFLMASSVVGNLGQRNTMVADIIGIHTATLGAVRPDIAANMSWDNCETAFGVYNHTVLDNMKIMCQQINEGIGLAADAPNGAKYYCKLFIRNYSSNPDGSSQPSVPLYMQAGQGGNAYKGTTFLGAGVNANGEYQGTLGAGVGAGNRTRQAKIWVPEVAIRFREWMKAIGAHCNDDPLFGGIIINETSVLTAMDTEAIPYGTAKGNPGSPTSNTALMQLYFQNYFQAVIDARPSFSKKPFFLSIGHPVSTSPPIMYGASPLSPSLMYANYAIGEYIQDGYAMGSYTPKHAVQRIAIENQPTATVLNPYMVFISGDVRRHTGVENTQTGASTSTHSASNGNKVFAITNPGSKTFTVATPRRVINILANRNEPNQVFLRGTVEGWAGGNLSVNITSFTGSGSRSSWEIAEVAAGAPDFLPPSTLDQMVTEAVTVRNAPAYSWATHKYNGATHVAFQINTTVKDRISENSRNYVDYINYMKTTSNRVVTTRPPNLDVPQT